MLSGLFSPSCVQHCMTFQWLHITHTYHCSSLESLPTAATASMAASSSKTSLPGYLVERPYVFSRASHEQVYLIAGLASVNLVGLLFLHYKIVYGGLEALILLRSGNRGVWAVKLVSKFHVVLVGYAILFLIIPLLRMLGLQWTNHRRGRGNERRRRKREWYDEQIQSLESSREVIRKLKFATRLAREGAV
jgi:hypothetical protein